MAGAAGRVLNRSGFASFIVKEWTPWMTEAVILHASGMSVPELRVRFQKTDTHIRNILNTEQASEIIRKVQSQALKDISANTSQKVVAIREAALSQMQELVTNEDLKASSPFAFWDATRKTLETVNRLEAPAPQPQQNISIQQNVQNIVNTSPDMLSRLRSAPSLNSIEVPENVEYLGSPPPVGQSKGAILGAGISGTESKGKDGLTLLSSRNSSSSD